MIELSLFVNLSSSPQKERELCSIKEIDWKDGLKNAGGTPALPEYYLASLKPTEKRYHYLSGL